MQIRLKTVTNENDIALATQLAREIWHEHYDALLGSAQVDYMLSHFQSKTAIKEQIGKGTVYLLEETMIIQGMGHQYEVIRKSVEKGKAVHYLHRQKKCRYLRRNNENAGAAFPFLAGVDFYFLPVICNC